jgi:hypothetical protein
MEEESRVLQLSQAKRSNSPAPRAPVNTSRTMSATELSGRRKG